MSLGIKYRLNKEFWKDGMWPEWGYLVANGGDGIHGKAFTLFDPNYKMISYAFMWKEDIDNGAYGEVMD